MKTESLESVALDVLFEHSPLGLALMDSAKRYVRINEKLAAMNGVSVADHIGRRPGEVLPDLAAVMEGILDHVLQTNKPMVGLDIATQTPTSPVIGQRFHLSLYPLSVGDEVIGVLGLVEEVQHPLESPLD